MSVFDEAVDSYGEDMARKALSVIDSYVDRVYPQVIGRPHPEMGRGKRMAFAMKLLDCMDEIGVTLEHMCYVLDSVLTRTPPEKEIDPTIFYATSPKVLGYWLLQHGDFSFDLLQGTSYQPVATYF